MESNSRIIPIILAGGSGERLWPLSRTAYPKQFLSLLGQEDSLFQQTIKRFEDKEIYDAPIIICHDEYRFIVAEQLRQIDVIAQAILLEPAACNTAPAIALGAHFAIQNHDNPNLLVVPADHLINELDIFTSVVQHAASVLEPLALMTFGIQPTRPETGYGYIQVGSQFTNQAFQIEKFLEKPCIEKAEIFYKDERYLWNSGMFLFKACAYLEELEKFYPEIVFSMKQALEQGERDLHFIRPAKELYKTAESISIDYAVMEKTDRAIVIPLNVSWSDVGSWQSVWEVSKKDENGNYFEGDVISQGTTNCLIDARSRLVATLDVHDLVIIETSDAILVAKRNESEAIKKLVKTLKSKQHVAATDHRKVMRPWGWYDSISHGERFQVKRLYVELEKSLSLQIHRHRCEHWVVVQGVAEVTCGDEVFLLNENESTFIPKGMKHQLRNVGKIPLEVVEVQSGSYLGEDDIVRLTDAYGRETVSIDYCHEI